MNKHTSKLYKGLREAIICGIKECLNIYNNREVEITDDHEDGIDISTNTNPTKQPFHVSDDLTIDLYSIFTRNSNIESDGNPLLYALKNEHDYKFRSKKALGFFLEKI